MKFHFFIKKQNIAIYELPLVYAYKYVILRKLQEFKKLRNLHFYWKLHFFIKKQNIEK